MHESFSIGDTRIGAGPCYVIAEIGSNHDGDLERALGLIDSCAAAGADAVKFQLFRADKIAADVDLPETRLRGEFARFGKNVHSLYKGMELPPEWLPLLKNRCEDRGVDFLATPFDEGGADDLAGVGVPAIKIASFEITHLPLLRHVGGLGLPVLLSTGMASIGEIRTAVDEIAAGGEERIALFHCGISYPVPFEDVHLRAMLGLRDEFRCPVGYSDHSEGIDVALAAAALGAAVYEKHVTAPGGRSPDHHFALTSEELAVMIRGIRRCEAALGEREKKVSSGEEEHLRRGRRSVFLVGDVKEGERFTTRNTAVLRPGTGIQPSQYQKVLESVAAEDMSAPRMLRLEDLR